MIEVKNRSNIQTLTNLGTLQTNQGSSVWVQAGSYVENLTNSGNMQGIEVGGTINNFTIDSNGIIYNNSNAIYAREGKINSLTIQGALKVDSGNAILASTWQNNTTSEIGNIHIDGGKVLSNVTHSTGIINLSNGTTNKITIGNGAIVGVLNPSSSNKNPNSVTINDIDKGGKGIHIEGSQVTGGIQIGGSGTYVNGIENGLSGGGNPGLIQGGINIENGATLGQIDNVGASTIAGNITIGNGSTLDKINNIQNSVILGGILYQGNGDLTINSSGIIKGENGTHIENSGSGNVKIENILIGTDNPHNISGNNTNNITFDKITLDTQGKPLPGHINDILTGSFDLNQIKTIVTDAGDIFNFTMDANGNFTTSLDLDNLNATSGAKVLLQAIKGFQALQTMSPPLL